MGKRAAVMMAVMAVLFWSDGCWCESGGTAQKTQQTMEDIKETGQAWTDWAYTKLSEGFVRKDEEAIDATHEMMDKAGGAAGRASYEMGSTASETARSANMAYEKSGEAANMAYGKAGEIRDYAADKANAATEAMHSGREYAADRASDAIGGAMMSGRECAGDKAYDSKETMAESMHSGREHVADKANLAKETMGGAVQHGREYAADKTDAAKETMRYGKDAAYNQASDRANDGKERLRERAATAYDQAKQKVNAAPNAASYIRKGVAEAGEDGIEMAFDAYEEAWKVLAEEKDSVDDALSRVGDPYSVSKEAKDKYETAKEKLSKATGDLGAKMQREPRDL